MRADLILSGFDEVVTLAAGRIPRRGAEMEELSRIAHGAIAVSAGTVVWTGSEAHLKREVLPRKGGLVRTFPGGVAMPGFVDAHTHLIFAGDRIEEIARKVRGESYLDIARSGGGLFRTVRETRAAKEMDLLRDARSRVRRLSRWGTTTVEVKSGYGLSLPSELKMLRVARKLSLMEGPRIAPTFLGAHAYPPEFDGRHAAYLADLIERQIPFVARAGLARFCDVFCEEGFFSARDAERVLKAGKVAGLMPKIHADEFTLSGGADVAARVMATSADHLVRTSAQGIARLARAGVTAVLLPVTPFASLSGKGSKGRELVDSNVPVALGSDLCPNSWVEAMPAVMSHAVYSSRLTPEEAITAATVNSAHAIGCSGDGRLVPGGRADIAIFDVPRTEHVASRVGVAPPVAVYIGGRELSPA